MYMDEGGQQVKKVGPNLYIDEEGQEVRVLGPHCCESCTRCPSRDCGCDCILCQRCLVCQDYELEYQMDVERRLRENT